MGFEQTRCRLSLLFLLHVHLEIFGTDLLHNELKRAFELADGLARAGELVHFRVFVGESTTVRFDHIEVRLRVKWLAQFDGQVDVRLLLHEDVLQAGLTFCVLLLLGLAARNQL